MGFLVNISDQVVETDLEARKALNFIETGKNVVYIFIVFLFGCNLVIQMLTSFFTWSRQPVQDAIIRLLPYVCT